MKRYVWFLLILLTLGACSRRDPTPTALPSPTLQDSPTPMAQFTPTPQLSPVPRITIVPSATRLQPTFRSASGDIDATSTSTVELTPTPVPSPTPTTPIIDAGATATQLPTATLAESPLPTPSPIESPLEAPGNTPSSVATSSTPSPTSEEEAFTPTPTNPTSSPPALTTTPTPTGQSEAWRFENVFTYYDSEYQEFYVWGELVNTTEIDQRIMTLWPVVYDLNGNPATTKDEVDAIGTGYKDLREGISLAPDRSLPFSFLVVLPQGLPVDENYDIMVEAEAAEHSREDLDIIQDDFDMSDWPYRFFVDGTFENPGADLTEYLAIVVTVYDETEHVIGVGWLYETMTSYLRAGENEFEVEVELWEIVDDLGLDVYSYKVQIFGY